jgi:hypothetical protein
MAGVSIVSSSSPLPRIVHAHGKRACFDQFHHYIAACRACQGQASAKNFSLVISVRREEGFANGRHGAKNGMGCAFWFGYPANTK